MASTVHLKAASISISDLKALILSADQVFVEGGGPVRKTADPSSKVSKLEKVVDDLHMLPCADFTSKVVGVLNRLGLKQTDYCFCSGQPKVTFYKNSTRILGVRVKHDDVVEIEIAGASWYYTGNPNLVTEFYSLLSDFKAPIETPPPAEPSKADLLSNTVLLPMKAEQKNVVEKSQLDAGVVAPPTVSSYK